MPVRADLSGRRLVVGVLLLSFFPALLAAAALSYHRPALPPGPPDYRPLALAADPVLEGLQARELLRSRRAAAAATALSAPALLAPVFPESLPTLVLAPRSSSYTLAELRRGVPAAFGTARSGLLVRVSIEVPTGAHLVIDSQTPDVRLLSTPEAFAVVIAQGGRLDVSGSTARPVHITSWDPARGAPDGEHRDGRSFLLEMGSRMDVLHADIGHLGFGSGTSSGVAWRGSSHTDGTLVAPASGVVTGSVFHENWFGAYTFAARDMRWTGNSFALNAAYGFDPHDFSGRFVVQGNRAYQNGRHGFIFSRGCNGNLLRNNIAFANRGHGFMIDDGRTEITAVGQRGRVLSNDNKLIGNISYDNAGSGVEIEGGTGNVVRHDVVSRNHVGIRVKDQASATVVGNKVSDSRLYGIDVLKGAGRVAIRDNDVVGGWASIGLGSQGAARLTGNRLSGASATLVVDGARAEHETMGAVLARFLRWNPQLVFWTAILWLPALLGTTRLLGWAVRLRPSPSRS